MSQTLSSEKRAKLYDLCKTLLGGQWAQVNPDDIIIKRNNDGFMNESHYCFLPQNINHLDTKYDKVIIRSQESTEWQECWNPKHVLTITLLLSERGLTPKVLGVFDNGTISQYIECRYFDGTVDLDAKAVTLLGQKLARFHACEMPVPRDSRHVVIHNVFDVWFNERSRESYRTGKVRQLIQDHPTRYPTFSALDLLQEMDWLRRVIVDQLQSPIVLSHNDFNRKNILITQTQANDLDIYIIDFDYCNYSYRGFDLGNYFSNWCQKEVQFDSGSFPTDQQMLPLIDSYRDQMIRIYGQSYANDAVNSRETIIREAKVFALMTFLIDAGWLIHVTEHDGQLDSMIKAEKRFQCYDSLKKQMLKQYTMK